MLSGLVVIDTEEAMERQGGAASGQRRGTVVAIGLVGFALWVGLGVLGFGSWSAFFGHPARVLAVVTGLLMTIWALASPVNLSSGEREDVADRVILVPSAAGILLLFWLLPYLDRHDRFTFGGDGVRWAGLAITVAGSVLRIWPRFVLGRRFSGLVAIQPGHELVSDGPYRYVRHPSYLGMMLAMLGWVLLFRSIVGLLVTAPGLVVLARRIQDEETMLASQFGAAYEAYRARTWRLLPWVY
jgi:protein-S-isoprenylcysteine O-methyltransferase Ste14